MDHGRRVLSCIAGMLLLAGAVAAQADHAQKTAIEQLQTMTSAEFQQLIMHAKKGDAAAQTLLAIAYMQGVRVPRDNSSALRLFLAAARKGQGVAENNLGLFYFYGLGTERNYAEAARWFKEASDEGSANAQFNLALMYDNGLGITKDKEEAAKWYQISAQQGEAAAQNSLAYMYENGIGVVKDPSQAKDWYRKSAEQGYVLAEYNIGGVYMKEGDHHAALGWFLRAAQKAHTGAIRAVAELYMHGHCMEVNYKEAYRWLTSTPLNQDWAKKLKDTCRSHLSPDGDAKTDTRAAAFVP